VTVAFCAVYKYSYLLTTYLLAYLHVAAREKCRVRYVHETCADHAGHRTGSMAPADYQQLLNLTPVRMLIQFAENYHRHGPHDHYTAVIVHSTYLVCIIIDVAVLYTMTLASAQVDCQ